MKAVLPTPPQATYQHVAPLVEGGEGQVQFALAAIENAAQLRRIFRWRSAEGDVGQSPATQGLTVTAD
jgi:hypothetical protein